jgi:replicative DNA helicase
MPIDPAASLRLPPHSTEAEQAVLGGLMLDPGAWERITLNEEEFYRRDHQLIYRTISELIGRGQPVDAVTLGDYLDSSGIGAQIGGSGYVLELAGNTPSAANIRAYAKIVREKSQLRRMIAGCEAVIGKAYAAGTDDPGALLDAAIGGLMALQRRDRKAEWSMREVLKQAFERITYAYEHKGQIPGLTTGLSKLDEHLGGFHPSDLTVIGGRPAMGKTALLFGMAERGAKYGPVGIISGEQPAVQLGLRMVSLGSGVTASKMRSGQIDDEDWNRISRAISDFHGLPIHVLDRAAPSIVEVARCARRWKHEHGIKALYVDYLQRLEGPGEKAYERVSAVTKGLKNIARDLDIPVIALAQVKREVEGRSDKRPGMADLCDSSEIEKEADQVITIYRDDYYNDNSPDKGTAELLICKNRHGECALARVAWMAQTMRFADLETRTPAPFNSGKERAYVE